MWGFPMGNRDEEPARKLFRTAEQRVAERFSWIEWRVPNCKDSISPGIVWIEKGDTAGHLIDLLNKCFYYAVNASDYHELEK